MHGHIDYQMNIKILKIWSDETKNNNKTFPKSVQSVTINTRTKQLQKSLPYHPCKHASFAAQKACIRQAIP
jgi:hypothetical protein